MAQAFRTPLLVLGKEPLLRRIVCEARYQDGQLYLDHCGRLLKRLLTGAPEWVVAPDPTPQGTAVYSLRTGVQLAFSMSSASLVLDKTATDEVIDEAEVAGFLEHVESTLGLVLDELEATEFTHVGYREHHYFSFETKEESEKWLQELGVATITPALYQAFATTPEALGVALVMQGEDCRYRIALNGIERSAQIPAGETVLNVRASAAPRNQKQVLIEALKKKRQRQINSAFAVVLDIDAFLLNPTEVNLRAFAQEHAETNLKRFREALPKDRIRKGK